VRLPAKKRFGQNYLVDDRISERIVRELDPRADETIVEIGPGQGALTSRLLKSTGRLIAIEFDRDLIPLLRTRFASFQNLNLVEADALAVDLCALIAPAKQAKVVANLPYYISTAILQRLIEQRSCISEMVLMLQREVVERITAPAGSTERGFLTVLVEAYCQGEALFDVRPTAFRPVPKVWSTVMRLRVRQPSAIGERDARLFWQIASAGFSQRRKTIFNNLRSATSELGTRIDEIGGAARALELAEIEARRRAETLTLEEWVRLTQVFAVP
jgi:16S rRNA (adenine1518-N6/adenine1519-N6)-dimethyltransferase